MSAVAEKIKFKKTGIEWMPEIPEHWEIVRLKNVVHGAINGVWGNEPQNNKNDIICVRVTDIDEWQYGINPSDLTLRNISEEDQSGRLLSYGDLLIEKSGGGEISPVGRVVIFNLNVKAVTSNFMARLNVNGNINKEFLYYYFRFLYHRRLNHPAIKATTGIQNLDLYSYLQNPLPLPPKHEQDEIVQYIKAKEEKINLFIQKKQRFIELLKEQRQTIITNAITKGVDDNIKTKNSRVEWLGNVPNHWKIVRLKFLGESFIGLTYSPIDLVDKDEGTFVLRSSNIQNGKFTTDDNVYVNKEIPEKLILKKGDILLCSRNGSAELIGKNILIDEESEGNSFGAFMTVFRSNLNYYLYYFFNSNVFKSQTALFATSTINQLTNRILSNLTIAFPENIDEQKRIIEHIKNETATIDAAIAKAEREIELIREYKEAMISEAVMGKRK